MTRSLAISLALGLCPVAAFFAAYVVTITWGPL